MQLRRKRLLLTGAFVVSGVLLPIFAMVLSLPFFRPPFHTAADVIFYGSAYLSHAITEAVLKASGTRSALLLTAVFFTSQSILYGSIGYFLSMWFFPRRQS